MKVDLYLVVIHALALIGLMGLCNEFLKMVAKRLETRRRTKLVVADLQKLAAEKAKRGGEGTTRKKFWQLWKAPVSKN